MSKKLLRTITEQNERLIEQFNKNYGTQARHGDIRVGQLTKEELKAMNKAVKDGNIEQQIELSKRSYHDVKELYLNMPDLKVSDNGSIQSLKVSVYSAEANNAVLLHKIFSKIREQA